MEPRRIIQGAGRELAMVFALTTVVSLTGMGNRAFGPGEDGGMGEEDDGSPRSEDLHAATIDGAGWDIPIQRTPDVERWIEFHTSGRGRQYFSDWLDRMSRYEGPIREELRNRALPEDLVYIALIESGFEPTAVSRARASGLWQFMAGTAREHGLLVNAYVDERLDPVRSTTAAIEFLDSLHDRFGSWYLAVAAYNAGPSRVSRVLRERVGGEGPWTDEHFWEIAPHLPSETRQHIPRLIAAAILGKEPARFGFHPETSGPRAFETVFTLGGTSLADVAAGAGVTLEEVRTLNPHLLGAVTPPERIYPVRVPVGTAGPVMAALSPGQARGAPQVRLGE